MYLLRTTNTVSLYRKDFVEKKKLKLKFQIKLHNRNKKRNVKLKTKYLWNVCYSKLRIQIKTPALTFRQKFEDFLWLTCRQHTRRTLWNRALKDKRIF